MRSRSLPICALLASFVLVLGCSSKEPPAEAPKDAGEMFDGPPCASDAHRLDGGACDSVLSWVKSAPIVPARAQHSTFIMEKAGKAFLYAVGGTDYTTDLSDAWFSPIAADGSLGAWKETAGLTTKRKGHATVVADTRVVVIGGKLDTAIVNNVFFSFVQEDGTLAKWLPGPALPGPRFGHSAVIAKGSIYVMGGIEALTAVSKVYRSVLGPGGFGDWKEVTPLNSPRTHHASFTSGNFLYVVGGYDGDPATDASALSDILRAPIQMDGSLGAWTAITSVDVPLATQSTLIHNGYLYLLGGAENGNDMTDHVRRATLGEDGAIGTWSVSTPPLPVVGGYNASTPLYKSRVYTVGGTKDQMSAQGEVNIGTFQ